MCTCRKRKRSNDDEQANEREQSSYAKMKLKMNNVQHELGQLRMELMETQQQKGEIEAVLEMMREEQQETNRNKRGGSKGGQSSYAKLKTQLEDTQRMKIVGENELVKVRIDLVAVRIELQETQRREREFESVVDLLRTELQDLTLKNEEHMKGMEDEMKGLKTAMGLRWLHIEKLKATITAGNISYDAMVARVEENERTRKQQSLAKDSSTRRYVCKAFGWSVKNVDATLLRAACGFWDATTLDAENNERASVKMREDMWYQLTCLGFKGKVLKKMEKGWKNLHKFDVVELARKSDVDSRFNSMSLSAVAHCQRGMRKYERGLLCSGATLRRTQKQVLDLATSVGFSSFPTHDNGNV